MCFFVMALHRCYLRSQNANCILDLVDCPIRLFQHPKNRGMCHFRSQYAKYKNANGLLDPKLRLSSCAESSLQLMPGCQRWHRRRRRALCHCGGCTLCTRVHFAIFNFRCVVQFSVIQLLRIQLKLNTALLSHCPSVRVFITGLTSHIYRIYKGINAMLIIRGPIKPYIFWLNFILAIFLAKTIPDKTILSALTNLTIDFDWTIELSKR